MMDRTTYLEQLASAVAWGLSSERPAWARTLERIEASEGRYRLEDLELLRSTVRQAVLDGVVAWFDPIYSARGPGALIPELEQPAQDIWRGLICMNQGIFDLRGRGGESPMLPLIATLPSAVPSEGPLYMSWNLDGWGVEPAPAE